MALITYFQVLNVQHIGEFGQAVDDLLDLLFRKLPKAIYDLLLGWAECLIRCWTFSPLVEILGPVKTRVTFWGDDPRATLVGRFDRRDFLTL